MLGDSGNAAQDLDWDKFGDDGVLGNNDKKNDDWNDMDNFMGNNASFLVSGAAIALTTVLAF